MKELESLASRLDAALTALEAAGGGGNDAAEAAELKAENRALRERVAALEAAREDDLRQLDALIAQLKPLVEEAM